MDIKLIWAKIDDELIGFWHEVEGFFGYHPVAKAAEIHPEVAHAIANGVQAGTVTVAHPEAAIIKPADVPAAPAPVVSATVVAPVVAAPVAPAV